MPHHLLLVEDNPGDAWLVRHLLEEIAGPELEVATVDNGEEALAYLRHEEPRYRDAVQPARMEMIENEIAKLENADMPRRSSCA